MNRWVWVDRIALYILVVLTLVALGFAAWTSHQLDLRRVADQAAALDRQAQLIRELGDQALAIRRSQADQRRAFRVLARRFEVLHGNEPGDAPDFGDRQSPNPPPERSAQPAAEPVRRDPAPKQEPQPRSEPREREPREREPRERPRPPPDPPSEPPEPLICVAGICLDP